MELDKLDIGIVKRRRTKTTKMSQTLTITLWPSERDYILPISDGEFARVGSIVKVTWGENENLHTTITIEEIKEATWKQ